MEQLELQYDSAGNEADHPQPGGRLNREELLRRLTRSTGLRREEVSVVLEGLLEEIGTTLVAGGRVELRGFGVFQLATRKARPARNPRSGEAVWLPERRVAVFKAAEKLKRDIDNT